MESATSLRGVALFAIVLVALSLVPVGAHFFELPNKMALPREQYMVVQSIYRGWSLFGIPIIGALAFTLAHTVMVRDNRTAFVLSLAAFLCIGATQVVFWAFTYPINVASQNWTTPPANFEAARWQWESSHAVNAVITFVSLVSITLSAIIYEGSRTGATAAGARQAASAP
jgi:membrane-associated phospholipid phosphatase